MRQTRENERQFKIAKIDYSFNLAQIYQDMSC